MPVAAPLVMSRIVGSASPGFTLVEVLVAIALLVAMALGVAQLIAVATRAIYSSREHTTAVVLAAAKIEELRSLAWTYEPASPGVAAAPRSDLTTDISQPDHPPGGRGLSESPEGALAANTPPYVDYLDRSGHWVGHGAEPPPAATFIRRWTIQPLADDPNRTLIFLVMVTTVREARSRTEEWTRRNGTDALLVSVRTRVGR